MRLLRKALPALALVVMVLAVQVATASAEPPLKFHLHLNSYAKGNGYNCGISEWSSTVATCGGSGQNGNAGTAGSFRTFDYVSWCNGDPFCASLIGGKEALPHGYTRWMKICGLSGNDCGSWLIGAVKMPNGPFLVLQGKVDGKAVARQSDGKREETDGGPLFLYVGFHGSINNGGGVPASNGYVFGFRGYLNFK